MKIKDLILKLQQYDLDKEVIGTWEGITSEIDIYESADGRVMVDVDGNDYKDEWQNKNIENDIVENYERQLVPKIEEK